MSESWVLLPDSEIAKMRAISLPDRVNTEPFMVAIDYETLAVQLMRLNPEGMEPETETQWGHGLGGIDPVRPMPEEAARFMAFGQGYLYKRTIQVGPWAVAYEEGGEHENR